MTKRREPLTYHYALTTIAALIGWDRCGAICSVTERMVRYWSDPDCETEIRLLDAERLDRAYLAAGGEYAPFHRLYSLRIELSEREQQQRSLSDIASGAAKETGEALSAMIDAAGNISCPTRRRHAKTEIQEAIGKLQDGLTILDAADGAGEAANVR